MERGGDWSGELVTVEIHEDPPEPRRTQAAGDETKVRHEIGVVVPGWSPVELGPGHAEGVPLPKQRDSVVGIGGLLRAYFESH